jgi:hypothetical protein
MFAVTLQRKTWFLVGAGCVFLMRCADTAAPVLDPGLDQISKLGSVRLRVVGPGRIQASNGQGCSTDCVFSAPASLVLVGIPNDENAIFRGFSGSCEGQGVCDVVEGEVTATFVAIGRLTVQVSEGGEVAWRDGGLCRGTCEVRIPSDGPLAVSAKPDPNHSLTRVAGVCSQLPCIVRSSGGLEVAFSPLRELVFTQTGAGTGWVEVRAEDAGARCDAFPCTVQWSAAQGGELSASGSPGSTFMEWSTCGRRSRCAIDAGSESALINVRFEPTFEPVKRLGVLGPFVPNSRVLALELKERGDGALLAISSARGVELDGVALSPPGGLTESFTLANVMWDGGVAWQHTVDSTSTDGGVQLWLRQLQSTRSRLVAGGFCLGTCPGTRGSIPFSPAIFEIDPGTGQFLRTVFPVDAGTSGFDFEWVGPSAIFAISDQLIDARSPTNRPLVRAKPYRFQGACEWLGESLQCPVWWAARWVDGACNAQGPVGQRAVGVVTLDSTSFSCLSLTAFDSTSPGVGTAVPAGVTTTDAGLVFVGKFTQSFSFGAGVTTPPGQSVAFVRTGGRPQIIASPAANAIDLMRRTDRFIALLITNPFFARTLFGTAVPASGAALIRVDAEDFTVSDITVFENVIDVSMASRGPELALFLRGADVRMAGTPLSPDGGNAAHLIRVREPPR